MPNITKKTYADGSTKWIVRFWKGKKAYSRHCDTKAEAVEVDKKLRADIEAGKDVPTTLDKRRAKSARKGLRAKKAAKKKAMPLRDPANPPANPPAEEPAPVFFQWDKATPQWQKTLLTATLQMASQFDMLDKDEKALMKEWAALLVTRV